MLITSGGGQELWPPPVVEYTTLDNGLRVAHASRSQRLTAICVLKDFGFIDDPVGLPGFAHLIEHLVGADDFTGEGVSSAAHLNGRTRFDSLDFYGAADAEDIEDVVERMTSRFLVSPSEADLARQKAVVSEEIRTRVDSLHLGGFPWTELPSTLFSDWPHSHNGYGSQASIDHVSLEQAVEGIAALLARPTTVGLVGPRRERNAALRVLEHLPAARPLTRPVAEAARHDSSRRSISHHPGRRALAAGVLVSDGHYDARSSDTARVIARLLNDMNSHRSDGQGFSPMSFTVGFFGPHSALVPEALIATSLADEFLDVGEYRARIRSDISRLAEMSDEVIQRALVSESFATGRRIDDSVAFARQLASSARANDSSAWATGSDLLIEGAEVRKMARALCARPMGVLDRASEEAC